MKVTISTKDISYNLLGASRYTSGNAKFKAFGQEQFYVEITREGWVYSPLLKEQFDVEKPRESERRSEERRVGKECLE